MPQKRVFILLPILVSTTSCMSLWFAGNAVFKDLQLALSLPSFCIGAITSAVHFGFITGTLLFAYWSVSDRFPARMVYFICALAGAAANFLILFSNGIISLVLIRYTTGFMLAGIYPVGMKIAFSWYQKDTGKAFGFLLGAFTLGTAAPHLLRSMGAQLDWRVVIVSTSLLAVAGGTIMLGLVPDGPHLPRRAFLGRNALAQVFRSRKTVSACLGYFGHMWELYTFWMLVPFYITAFARCCIHGGMNVSLWTFITIASGCIGCIGGGFLSGRFGSARVAFVQLAVSGVCCLTSPFLLKNNVNPVLFICFLLVWGACVVGDSPQFSSLVSHYSEKSIVGTSLTLMNCIGFFISIISIECASRLLEDVSVGTVFVFLAPGPFFGLAALFSMAVSRADKQTNGTTVSSG